MKYKFIASDFDGTLLNSKDAISKRNIEAVNEYIKAGGYFTVATGRTFASLTQRLPELCLPPSYSVPLITFQGSLMTDIISQKQISAVYMENETLCRVTEFAKENGIYCHIYSLDKMFIEQDCDIARLYCKYNRILDGMEFVGNLPQFIKTKNPQIVKAIYIDDEDVLSKAMPKINKIVEGKTLFTRSAPNFIECVSPLSGKGKAVLAAAADLRIGRDEVIAVGDSMNDYTMIEAAGLGIAVANAEADLKKKAKMVAPVSNDEDAIAWIIDKALKDEL